MTNYSIAEVVDIFCIGERLQFFGRWKIGLPCPSIVDYERKWKITSELLQSLALRSTRMLEIKENILALVEQNPSHTYRYIYNN